MIVLQVAEFPVFTRSGQESVCLSLSERITLTPAEFDKVTAYHAFVFHNVLRIDKDPLTLGTDQSDFNILVTPVTEGKCCLWHYMFSSFNLMSVFISFYTSIKWLISAYLFCHSNVGFACSLNFEAVQVKLIFCFIHLAFLKCLR